MANFGQQFVNTFNEARRISVDREARTKQQQASQAFGDILGGQSDPSSLANLGRLDPQLALKAQAFTQDATNQKELKRVENLAQQASVALTIQDPAQRNTFLQRRANQLDAEGQDSSQLREIIALPPAEQSLELQNFIADVADIKSAFRQGQAGTDQRFFESLASGVSAEDKVLAGRIELGLSPRAVGTGSQTIAKEGTAEQVAAAAGTVAGGTERGKLSAQLKLKPQIERAVTLAKKAAAAEGEAFTDLKRSEAALPGLLESVDQLKELAAMATSTIGGRIFDTAVKESGFGSTKGADARVKFVAIINNQVLPLLKQTFGAAFTEREGETLKATMGDPNATPEQKVLQLEAFIDQKVRDIQSTQRELGAEITPSAELSAGPTAQPTQVGRFTVRAK